MNIDKVLIVGSGTMGAQIAFQCALRGFDTAVADVSEQALEACRADHRRLAEMFVTALRAAREDVETSLRRISYTTDLAAAARDTDLVSESIPEDLSLKRQLFGRLDELCPPRTIFTTNTSTLLPSQLADASGRPDRFLALHFANPVWYANIGEVMGHPGTDPEVLDRVARFAAEIGMVPIVLSREQTGYVINSLLVPLLTAAQSLVTNAATTPEDVDRTWMIATGMPRGPFGIMDLIGLETIYNVTAYWARVRDDDQLNRNAAYLKRRFLDLGRLGLKTGEGYYSYPEPAYEAPEFLSGAERGRHPDDRG
jgi:3-hydroxybutyryl-CoA dehydrogenase